MILAHGVGSRADLPVEPWLFAYGAAFALLISFAALRLLWPRPRLAAAAEGSPAPAGLDGAARIGGVVLQVVAVVLFVATLVAAWIGPDSVADNLAPTALYIAFWVGLQLLSPLVGDVWRRANPLWLLAAGLDRIRGRHPDTSAATGWWASHWPAALGLLAFVWLELAYFEPASLTAVALFLSGYTIFVLAGAARFGAGWVRTGDGFAVLLSLLAALAPLHRDAAGRLRWRVPGAGLATVAVRPGTLAVVVVVLGGTTFDGVTRTQRWSDLAGGRREWELTAVSSLGLALTIAAVALAYLVAVRLVGWLAGDDVDVAAQADRWAPTLIPIALGTRSPTTSRCSCSRARGSSPCSPTRSVRGGTCSAPPATGSTTRWSRRTRSPTCRSRRSCSATSPAWWRPTTGPSIGGRTGWRCAASTRCSA